MNKEEFEDAWEENVRIFYTVAKKYVSGKEEIEDLLQEVAGNAYKAYGNFDGAYFKAWVCTIIKNTFLNNNNKNIVRSNILTVAAPIEDLDMNVKETVDSAEMQAVKYKFSPEITNTIKSLPKEQAEALLLLAEGYEYLEIASIMGVKLGTVSSRVSRARANAQKALANQ